MISQIESRTYKPIHWFDVDVDVVVVVDVAVGGVVVVVETSSEAAATVVALCYKSTHHLLHCHLTIYNTIIINHLINWSTMPLLHVYVR